MLGRPLGSEPKYISEVGAATIRQGLPDDVESVGIVKEMTCPLNVPLNVVCFKLIEVVRMAKSGALGGGGGAPNVIAWSAKLEHKRIGIAAAEGLIGRGLVREREALQRRRVPAASEYPPKC